MPINQENTPINVNLLAEYIETPQDMLFLLSTFMKQSDESLSTMKQSLFHSQHVEWSEAAHKFKGGCSLVGANDLYKLCAEAQCMEEKIGHNYQKILEKIETEYSTVKKYINDNYLTN